MNEQSTHSSLTSATKTDHRAACELVCIGIAGTTLLADEARLLADGVRNVILFARNYQNATQLTHLTAAIR